MTPCREEEANMPHRTRRAGQRAGNEPDLRRIGLHPDFWYPLALAHALKAGHTLAATFAGEPIVLVRTASGQVFALEDRCAHRQVPLHLGVVDGEQLQCGYHGWRYHATGRLVTVPYLPKGARIPGSVRAYPCREAYGLIFVLPGDPEKAAGVALPDIPRWSSPRYKTMYFARLVRCHYSFMHENLMDMNHQFLHRCLMGSMKPALLEARKGEAWVEATYKFEKVSKQRHVGARLMLGSKDPDPQQRHFDLMTIRTTYPYQTPSIKRPTSDEPALDLWVAYVPTDREQRSHQSFGLLMLKKPKVPGLIHLLWPVIRHFTEKVFAEDRRIVEAEQRAYDLQGADWNQEVFPVILALRDVLIRCGIPLKARGHGGRPERCCTEELDRQGWDETGRLGLARFVHRRGGR
jgi:phenylpropionate dioxygenase-like ring-hydroxylating dioxygenase large terminal subunit